MRPPEPDPLPLRVDVINGWPPNVYHSSFELFMPCTMTDSCNRNKQPCQSIKNLVLKAQWAPCLINLADVIPHWPVSASSHHPLFRFDHKVSNTRTAMAQSFTSIIIGPCLLNAWSPSKSSQILDGNPTLLCFSQNLFLLSQPCLLEAFCKFLTTIQYTTHLKWRKVGHHNNLQLQAISVLDFSFPLTAVSRPLISETFSFEVYS